MSSKTSYKYSSKTSEEHEPIDPPPAYTPTADYIPSNQQQVYSPPPVNPTYLPSVGSSSIAHPPYQQQQQQQQQVDYHDRQNRTMSTFQYNFNRGIIGNALDFASHSVSGATSRASAKSKNDAAKAVLDTVGGFLENRLNKKDQRDLRREMKLERRQECRELRREAKQERRAHRHCDDDYTCSHNSCNHPQEPQPPQPHQRYGGSSYCCSRKC